MSLIMTTTQTIATTLCRCVVFVELICYLLSRKPAHPPARLPLKIEKFMKLTKQQLYLDLFFAFLDAKRHKAKRGYVKKFKKNLKQNLLELCDDLYNRIYKPQPSSCFIITYPKKREVFAANFRDRIVHHLYFNYTHQLFENTYIYDSYSCIKKKGTHFGIQRLEKHIRQVSNTWKNKAYILKMDIRGYFMHIDRNLICKFACESLDKLRFHIADKETNEVWDDLIDVDFVKYLTREIALLDPTIDCKYLCSKRMWQDLPKSKSLFYSGKDCGLPIGNLTSQLFSNIYLNNLDQYIKRELRCKHYGRYVDDFFIVSESKNELHRLIPLITHFLKENLHLDVQQGKTTINNSNQGVEFLGAYIKPFRTYISNASLRRMNMQMSKLGTNPHKLESVNSFLGNLSHYKSYNIRKHLFKENAEVSQLGIIADDISKVSLFKNKHCNYL